jgi:hypothetical protein
MAFLHVYIRMGSTQCRDYYLCHKEKYTPRDMAFLHVYQNGIYAVLLVEIYTGTWHSSMYIWDLHGSRLLLVPQREKYTPRT